MKNSTHQIFVLNSYLPSQLSGCRHRYPQHLRELFFNLVGPGINQRFEVVVPLGVDPEVVRADLRPERDPG